MEWDVPEPHGGVSLPLLSYDNSGSSGSIVVGRRQQSTVVQKVTEIPP